MTEPIGIINVSTVCPDDEIRHYVAALQMFLPEFERAWALDHSDLGFLPSGQPVPDGLRLLIVADDSDQAGALGYHELSQSNLPIGYCFAGTDKKYGTSVSVTLAHEYFEMRGDPMIDKTLRAPDGRLFIVENCDAVEDDGDAIVVTMPNGPAVLLSDFVLPSYFDFNAPHGVAYDYKGVLTSPIPTLRPGGYLAYQDTDGTWNQITARATPEMRARARPHVLSRRYRRMFRAWETSTAT